jgi:uncharacterized lipoprotein
MTVRVKSWLLICLVVGLAGCVPSTLKTSESKLRDTLRLYESTVRWGQIERIYSFLKPEMSEGLAIPENLRNVRVTSYETLSGPAPVSETRWLNTVVIQYVMEDSQVVKTLTDEQVWEQVGGEGGWYRANPIPAF